MIEGKSELMNGFFFIYVLMLTCVRVFVCMCGGGGVLGGGLERVVCSEVGRPQAVIILFPLVFKSSHLNTVLGTVV